MVIGTDSHTKGHGFKSRHRVLDGHFFTYIFCKNCNDVCLTRPKINEKEAGVGPFLKLYGSCIMENIALGIVIVTGRFSSLCHSNVIWVTRSDAKIEE